MKFFVIAALLGSLSSSDVAAIRLSAGPEPAPVAAAPAEAAPKAAPVVDAAPVVAAAPAAPVAADPAAPVAAAPATPVNAAVASKAIESALLNPVAPVKDAAEAKAEQ